ncbi:MAG: phosphoglucosamine mutase [Acidobacteriota bacterium]
MSRRLFGTDGIRGRAGEYPLDRHTVAHLGRSLIEHLSRRGLRGRVAIGYDTRASSESICASLLEGICHAGGEALVAGVIPTPGVAFLTRADGFDAGVVISASHNPYQDNGIKVFQSDGTKLSDGDEAQVEAGLLDPDLTQIPAGPAGNGGQVDPSLAGEYAAHLIDTVRGRVDLTGARVVIDCANGASSAVAPRVFAALGVEATVLSCDPDGTNINRGCGSLHPDGLARAVRAARADAGLAFDGDADRCLAVDDTGRILDGDYILYLTGTDLNRRGHLPTGTIVATVMSNLWLEERFASDGLRLLRAPVGDKYVLDEMARGGHVLGGEQSGHVIFRDLATTGDGILTGLMLLAAWKSDGRRLSEMVAGITPHPQVLINVAVADKPDLDSHAEIGPLLRRAARSLAGRGRLLVRYSGTEPLARVMAEGRDADEIHRIAGEVAAALRDHLV